MTTVKITDLPDYCFTESGDLFVESLMVHLGSAMRFRLAGQRVQQFRNNPATNDDGYRDLAQAGWASTHEGDDFALISLFVKLQPDHLSENYPTMASAALSHHDGEIPVIFKKSS